MLIKNKIVLKPDTVFLFQGDSITDCGRTEGRGEMGEGYPKKISDYFAAFHKELNISFINRGIGGNTSYDLAARWQSDCIDLKPDYLSILIGINDVTRIVCGVDGFSLNGFEENLRKLITEAKEKLGCQIIISEPYIIPIDRGKDCWRGTLNSVIEITRKIAREFHTAYIPLDGIMNELCCGNDLLQMTYEKDGVHPKDAGHTVIAQEMLKRLEF